MVDTDAGCGEVVDGPAPAVQAAGEGRHGAAGVGVRGHPGPRGRRGGGRRSACRPGPGAAGGLAGVRRGRPARPGTGRRPAAWADPSAVPVRGRGVGGGPDRGRRAGQRTGDHRGHHRRRGGAGGAHGVVHQGMLHRPGAGGPARRPGLEGGPHPLRRWWSAPRGSVGRRGPGGRRDRPDGRRGGDGGGGPPVGAEVWTADGEHLVGTLSSVAWSTGPRGHGGPGHPAPAGRPPRGGLGALDRPGRRRTGRAAEARTLPLVG